MSLASKDFSITAKAWGVALLSSAAMMSVANAAEIKELGAIDLSRPVPQGVCVADSAGGRAFDKLEAIKKARGQTNIVEANTVHVKGPKTGAFAGVAFSSNLQPVEGKKSVLGEGYMVTSNAPKNQKGTLYCFNIANDTTQLASAITGSKVPGTVNIGEIGQGLNNAMNRANSKVGYVAVTNERTLLAVSFNYTTKEGSYVLADGSGNNPLPIGLVDVEYSLELPLAYQKALGIPAERIASVDPQHMPK